MSKNSTWFLLFVGFTGSIVGIVLSIVAMRGASERTEKAKVYDEICAATKAHIRSSISFLNRNEDPQMQDYILEQFDNRHLGETVRIFDWCSKGPEVGRATSTDELEKLGELSSCRNRRDIPCVVRMLKDVESKIP